MILQLPLTGRLAQVWASAQPSSIRCAPTPYQSCTDQGPKNVLARRDLRLAAHLLFATACTTNGSTEKFARPGAQRSREDFEICAAA